VKNLVNLMNTLLTWARLQQGTLEFHPNPISVKWLVARNIEILSLHAAQKQITLENLVEDEISVHADNNMLNTIIRNLISNALKFTPEGGIVTISTQQHETSVELSVSDTGIGIGPEDLAKLFRIDMKFKRPGTAREEGTGLGLLLCKEFIERHGGRISIKSEVGKGTTITCTLPKEPIDNNQ